MGFFSYIKYKSCFDWAYGRRAGEKCIKFITANLNTFRTSDSLIFCVKEEEE